MKLGNRYYFYVNVYKDMGPLKLWINVIIEREHVTVTFKQSHTCRTFLSKLLS